MRQRQIARQRYRLLPEFFDLQLLLPQQLLSLVKPLFGMTQFLAKLFAGRSELSVFLGQFLRASSLGIPASKEIPGRFVPGRFVLTDRFGKKES